MKSRHDFVFISICGDPITGGKGEQEVKEFVRKFGINYVVLFDNPENSLAQKFNVQSWPSKFLLDETGGLLMEPGDGIRLEIVEAYLANKTDEQK